MNARAPRISFLLLLIILMISFGVIIRPFLLPALIALIIAVICWPVNRVFLQLLRGRRTLAAIFATIVVALCILVPLGTLISIAAVNSVSAIKTVISNLEVGHIAHALDRINMWVQDKASQVPGVQLPELNIRARLLEAVSAFGSFVYQYSPKVFTATISLFFGAVLIVIFLFLFFLDGPVLFNALISLVPLKGEHKDILVKEIAAIITGTFTGMIATACAQGLLIGIGYWIAGIANPLVWGVLAIGVTLIPVIGAPLMYVPPAIALMIGGHWYQGIFLFLYGVFIVSIADNIIKPLAMRGKVNVHPVLLALALIGGALWLGGAGIVVGPMIVALMLAMLRIYRKEFL
ncbi:MAG: AI-2E family transporter [Desulfobacterota bacterium]|nr:AI-2E family transporter [Thermodesulfobacteriota bacterium]